MRLGGQEWLIILLIILLIFGARKLPELARSLGSSAKEFRKGIEEGKEGEETTQSNSVESDPTDASPSDSSEVSDP